MASIQGIYVALFGRPADPAGLAYFNAVTGNGSNLSGIGDLTTAPEYQSRFVGLSNTEIVNSIYMSLFGRAADPEGLAFFLGELESGKASIINTIAINILDGAKGDDLTTINAKIAAADLLTSHVDLQVEVDAYVGDANAAIAREYLAAVNSTHAGTGAEADAAILRMLGNGGQEPGNGNGTGGGGGGGGTSNTIFNLTGAAGDDAKTGDDAHWVKDRVAPTSLLVTSGPAGSTGNVLAFTVKNVDEYVGSKYVAPDGSWNAEHGSDLTYKFFVDASWVGDNEVQRSSVWVQMTSDDGSGPRYAIAEYLDHDAVVQLGQQGVTVAAGFDHGFRFWSEDSGWTYRPSDASGWVNVKFDFDATVQTWSVNGTTQYSDSAGGVIHADTIETVIVNSGTNVASETYYYDNIQLVGTTAAETAMV